MSKSKSVFDIFSSDEDEEKKKSDPVSKAVSDISKAATVKQEYKKDSSAAAESIKANAVKRTANKTKVSTATNTPTASSNDIAKQLLAAALPKVQTDGYGGNTTSTATDGLFGVKDEKVRRFRPSWSTRNITDYAKALKDEKRYTPLMIDIANNRKEGEVYAGHIPRTGLSIPEYIKQSENDIFMPKFGTKAYYQQEEKRLRSELEKYLKKTKISYNTTTQTDYLVKTWQEDGNYIKDLLEDYKEVDKYLNRFNEGAVKEQIEYVDTYYDEQGKPTRIKVVDNENAPFDFESDGNYREYDGEYKWEGGSSSVVREPRVKGVVVSNAKEGAEENKAAKERAKLIKRVYSSHKQARKEILPDTTTRIENPAKLKEARERWEAELAKLPDLGGNVWDKERESEALSKVYGSNAKAYTEYYKEQEARKEGKGKEYNLYTTMKWGEGVRDIKSANAGKNAMIAGTDKMDAVAIYSILTEQYQKASRHQFINKDKPLTQNKPFYADVVSNIAQNAPQMGIQTAMKFGGMVVDALTLGSGVGSAAANVLSASFMYQQTAGSSYIRQLQNGLSIEDARALASSEALVSGSIELGLGFASDMLSKGTKAFKKEWTGKNFALRFGDHDINISTGKIGEKIAKGHNNRLATAAGYAAEFKKNLLKAGISEKGVAKIIKTSEVFADRMIDTIFEGLEEGWQEAVSVTADNYSKDEDNTNPIKLLGHSIANLSKYTDEELKQIKESGKWGAIVGGMMNVPVGAFNVAIDSDVRSSQTHKQRGENFIKSLNDGGVWLSLEDAAEVLIDRSKEYSENGYAAENAKKLGEKIAAKKEITLADLGKQDLYNRMEALEFGQYSDAVNRLNGTKVVTTDTQTNEGDSATGSSPAQNAAQNPATSSQSAEGGKSSQTADTQLSEGDSAVGSSPAQNAAQNPTTSSQTTTDALPQGTVGSYKDGTITVDGKSQGKTDTLTHETGHSLEKTKAYGIYTEQLETTSAYAKCRQDIKSRYAAAGLEISDAQLRIETAAEMAINFAPDTPEKIDRLTRLANSNSQLIRNISNALRILTAKMKDKGKGKFVDKITGTELTYQEAVRLQILYENALIESGKTYSKKDVASSNDVVANNDINDVNNINEADTAVGNSPTENTVQNPTASSVGLDGDKPNTSTYGIETDAQNMSPQAAAVTDTNTEYRVAPTPDNTDAKDYGLDVDRAIRRFSSNTNTGVKAKAFTDSGFATGIRDAFNLFSEGKFDEGHSKLTELGDALADGKKKGVDNLGDKVADYFEGVYKRGQYIKAADNAYPQFQSDMDNLHVNVPVYTYTLATQYNSDTGISDMYRIEQKIREGMTALSEGKSGRKSFKEAAEILVESATNNDGTRKYKADEYKDAVRKAVDTMEEKFTNEQPASEQTPDARRAADRQRYGRDIERDFRGGSFEGITEGEVVQLGGVIRGVVDYISKNHDTDVNALTKLVNKKLQDVVRGHKHSDTDVAAMNFVAVKNILAAAEKDIGNRRREARDAIKKAVKAGEGADSTTIINANKMLELCTAQEKMIQKTFSSFSVGDYEVSSMGKRRGNVKIADKYNSEFQSKLDERTGDMTYVKSHNADIYEKGIKKVQSSDPMKLMTDLANRDVWTAEDVGVAAALIKEFGEMGMVDEAAEVFVMTSARATAAGQMSQATRIFGDLTAEGQVAALEKMNNKMVENQMADMLGKSVDEVRQMIDEARQKDAKERAEARNALRNNKEWNDSQQREMNLKRRLEELAQQLRRLKSEEGKKDATAENMARRANEYERKKRNERAEALREIRNRKRRDAAESIKTAARERDVKRNNGVNTEELRALQDANAADERVELADGEALTQDEIRSEIRRIREEILTERSNREEIENEYIITKRKSDDVDLGESRRKSSYGILKDNGGTAEDLKTHVDALLEKNGIKNVTTADFDRIKEISRTISDMKSADELIDLILKISGVRNTATAKRRQAVGDVILWLPKKIASAAGVEITLDTNAVSRALKRAEKEIGLDGLKRIATNQCFGMLQDLEPVQNATRLKTLMHVSHLLSVPTIMRNITSTALFSGGLEVVSNDIAWLLEWLVVPFTGRKVIGFESPISLKQIKAGRNRMNLANLEQALNVDIIGSESKYIGSPARRRTFKGNNILGRAGATLERSLGYALNGTDQYYKGVTEQRVKDGLMRAVRRGHITEGELKLITEYQMDYRTFNDDSHLARMLSGIREALNVVGIGDSGEEGKHTFGLGDLIIPYGRTAGNVLSRDIAYTPLGLGYFLRNVYDFAKAEGKTAKLAKNGGVSRSEAASFANIKAQRDMVTSLARTITATGLMTAGAYLFSSGIITRDEDDEEYKLNVSALGRVLNGEENDDKPVNGDVLVNLTWLTPTYTQVAMGAALSEAELGEKGIGERVAVIGQETVNAEFEQVLGLSIISTIGKMYNNYQYADEDNKLVEFIGSTVGEMAVSNTIPAPMRQLGTAWDDYSRNPYNGENWVDVLVGKAKSKLPIQPLREQVPIRRDEYGEPVKNTLGNKTADFLNNLMSPGRFERYSSTELADALSELADGDDKLLEEMSPTKASKRHSGKFEDGSPYEFSVFDDDYEEYQHLQGEVIQAAMLHLINNSDTLDLSREELTTRVTETKTNAVAETQNLWVAKLQGATDEKLQEQYLEYIDSIMQTAWEKTTAERAKKYILLDGVNLEDIGDFYYYTEVNGKKKKVYYTGEYKDLADKQKKSIKSLITSNPDRVTLPDNIRQILEGNEDIIKERTATTTLSGDADGIADIIEEAEDGRDTDVDDYTADSEETQTETASTNDSGGISGGWDGNGTRGKTTASTVTRRTSDGSRRTSGGSTYSAGSHNSSGTSSGTARRYRLYSSPLYTAGLNNALSGYNEYSGIRFNRFGKTGSSGNNINNSNKRRRFRLKF